MLLHLPNIERQYSLTAMCTHDDMIIRVSKYESNSEPLLVNIMLWRDVYFIDP